MAATARTALPMSQNIFRWIVTQKFDEYVSVGMLKTQIQAPYPPPQCSRVHKLKLNDFKKAKCSQLSTKSLVKMVFPHGASARAFPVIRALCLTVATALLKIELAR